MSYKSQHMEAENFLCRAVRAGVMKTHLSSAFDKPTLSLMGPQTDLYGNTLFTDEQIVVQYVACQGDVVAAAAAVGYARPETSGRAAFSKRAAKAHFVEWPNILKVIAIAKGLARNLDPQFVKDNWFLFIGFSIDFNAYEDAGIPSQKQFTHRMGSWNTAAAVFTAAFHILQGNAQNLAHSTGMSLAAVRVWADLLDLHLQDV